MKKIEGYIFLAEKDLFRFMFGKPIHINDGIYENIESNGLVPYETLEQTRNAAKHFLKFSDFYSIFLARLWMKIAETKEELNFFRDKTNLVVIMKDYDDISKTDHLLGPLSPIKGGMSAYPLPGAYLSTNRAKTYKRKKGSENPFERALHQLKEINRQGQCPATIAQFRLNKLEKILS